MLKPEALSHGLGFIVGFRSISRGFRVQGVLGFRGLSRRNPYMRGELALPGSSVERNVL